MHSSRLRTARSLPYRGGLCPGGLCQKGWGLCPEGGGRVFLGGVLSQVDRPPRGQTDACENIALPQTSFAGGNKKDSLHVEKVNAKASSLPNENVLFVYAGEKATSLPDGFMGNPIECSREAATKIKDKVAFAMLSLESIPV